MTRCLWLTQVVFGRVGEAVLQQGCKLRVMDSVVFGEVKQRVGGSFFAALDAQGEPLD